jgi:hypothetical protein
MKVTLIFLSVLLCFSSWAEKANILEMTSPKLRQFLISHPVASVTLSNISEEAFSNRSVGLFYFYSDNESIARASHSYLDEGSVSIFIRENQKPCDECICLIFEMINSEGEKRFLQLMEMAKSGTISKQDFVKEMMRKEFEAVRKIQLLIGGFNFSKPEMLESYYYDRLVKCPSKFEDFLAYKKKVSPNRDQVKEYEQTYDYLQKNQP